MRPALLYLVLIGAPVGLLLLIVNAGSVFAPTTGLAAPPAPSAAPDAPYFLLTLLLQVAVVLMVARAVGELFRRLRQPRVVGEMVAGIMLGPSLLGWVAPGVFAALFPAESLGYLNTLSQIGLVLFMFLVGLEFDPRLLRGRGHTAFVTSHVSIAAPFVLGAALALFLYPRLAEPHVEFAGFALFMGAAMSITAFPVLARILSERNLMHSEVGALSIACAAIGDVTAWCILAILIAIIRADAASTPLTTTLAGTVLFVLVMVLVVRRALGWLESFYHSRGRLTQDMLAIALLLLLASAWTTEWLGIHALFGAFALGTVMPKDPGFTHDVTERLEDVTVVFLLPLFFAFTGLRTSIGLVSGVDMWALAGLILLVAVVGKFGGSAVAARATGMPWRESAAIGVLMNTRGLMELVILTIGLDLGVISPTLFAMMVMMALITTFMTTPLLELVYPARLIRQRTLGSVEDATTFTTLIPVSLPASGPRLLAAARLLAPRDLIHHVYALHLHVAGEQSLTQVPHDRLPSEEAVLRPLLEAAAPLDMDVRPLSLVSRRPADDISDVARYKRADLVLLGSHRPVISRSVLGGTVYEVLERVDCDVVVFIDRGIGRSAGWSRILVPYAGGIHDDAAVEIARRIASNSPAALTVLHITEPGQSRPILQPVGVSDVIRVESSEPAAAVAEQARLGYDLLVVGVNRSWGMEPTAFGPREEELARVESASLMVVRRHRAPR
jgi:Kef-type K+ transport system membrane component KefB/nucleotide-binding universal stress UspA family protein